MNTDKTQRLVFTLRDLQGVDNGESVKFLGAYLDPTLRWDVQVESVSRRLGSCLFLLKNLKGIVSMETLLSAYYALFNSVMTYGIMAWGGASSACRVFALQRKAVRVMAGLGFREDCRGAFRDLGILTFQSVFILESIIYVKKNESSFVSHGDIHDYPTRGRDDLVTAYCRLKKCRYRPEHLAIKLYNKLPPNVRSFSVTKLKSFIKEILTGNVFYSIDEFLFSDQIFKNGALRGLLVLF